MSTPLPPLVDRTFANRLKRRLAAKFQQPASPPAGGKAVGAGLIGAGNFARWAYVPRLRAGFPFKLHAVYDVDAAAAKQAADATGARLCKSVAEVVGDPAVEAVFVVTPVKRHYDAVLAALDAKKHVLCEKPLANDLREAQVLCERARQLGCVNMVHFSHRWNAELAFVTQLVHGGAIGRVHHVTGLLAQGGWFNENNEPSNERVDAAPWKLGPEGGVVQDLGPHLIDFCRTCFGEVTQVQASLKSLRPGAYVTDDLAGLNLTFADGAVAHVVTSRWATSQKHRISFEIYGSLGAIHVADTVRFWKRREPRWRDLLVPVPEKNFLQLFHEGITKPGTKLPDFLDGMKNNEVLEAIVRSAKTGAPVALPAA